MKKSLSLIVAIFMITGIISACTQNRNNIPLSEAPQPQQSNEQQVQTPASAPDTSAFIDEEKAKSIALEKAGLTAGEVRFDRVELDGDNGIWHYEVEFKKDRTEYDADINATDGTILKWEIDMDD